VAVNSPKSDQHYQVGAEAFLENEVCCLSMLCH